MKSEKDGEKILEVGPKILVLGAFLAFEKTGFTFLTGKSNGWLRETDTVMSAVKNPLLLWYSRQKRLRIDGDNCR